MFPTQTLPDKLIVLQSLPPERPYVEMGSIRVSCPIIANRSSSFTGLLTDGGCTFDEAAENARNALAKVGADGMFGITTSSAANGRLISFIASAFKYQTATHPTDRSAGAGPSASQTSARAVDRLLQLKDLRDKSLISSEEYENRKAEIIKQI